jgi:excisionase family DNA binding protein
MSDDQLLTPKDIAARCQINPKTVLRAIRSGRLRASQLGERAAYRVAEEDFQAWLAATVVTPPMRAPAEPTPLRVVERPAAGRLRLTPDMGRSTH